ncbi:hypothetical protein FKP32DRAFT_1438391 [Trametes sanguinea]|nr:hypothetical protein FKP32DRAFT_1438391 [Trametes sanguinea]
MYGDCLFRRALDFNGWRKNQRYPSCSVYYLFPSDLGAPCIPPLRTRLSPAVFYHDWYCPSYLDVLFRFCKLALTSITAVPTKLRTMTMYHSKSSRHGLPLDVNQCGLAMHHSAPTPRYFTGLPSWTHSECDDSSPQNVYVPQLTPGMLCRIHLVA